MLDANTQAIIDAVSTRVVTQYSPNTSIIDLGYGEGWLLKALKHNGFTHLTGLAYQPRDLEGVRTIGNIDLCSENWSSRVGVGQYQLAIATEVIEHLTNPFLFLLETRKLLIHEGELILTFPNVHNWRSIVGYALTGRLSGFFGPNFNEGHPLHDQHIFIPNMHLIRYLLRVAGFSVTAEQPVNGKGCLFAQTMLVIARRNDHA